MTKETDQSDHNNDERKHYLLINGNISIIHCFSFCFFNFFFFSFLSLSRFFIFAFGSIFGERLFLLVITQSNHLTYFVNVIHSIYITFTYVMSSRVESSRESQKTDNENTSLIISMFTKSLIYMRCHCIQY